MKWNNRAIKEDPLYFDIIPIYCACLLELEYLGELYYCAHNLSKNKFIWVDYFWEKIKKLL